MREDFNLKNSLSIVTVFHNHISFVDAYFRSYQRVYGSLPCNLIVIDNDSNDGTKARLEWWRNKEGFQFKYHPLKENLGFGAVHNTFIADIDTNNLLFLNPDVSFTYDFLTPCIKALDQYQGIISPLFKDLSGMHYSSYSPFFEIGRAHV